MGRDFSRRQALHISSLIAAGISLSACTDQSTAPSDDSSEPLIFHFANAAAAPSLDVVRSGTLETARISAQILEPLVKANANTGEPEPGLARGWDISDDGLTYTFHLQEHVLFHDGTLLDAAAVVTNYKRWKAVSQDTSSTAHVEYLQLLSSLNSSDGKTPLVTQCVDRDNSVVITLSRPSTSFLRALTQPAFGIGSPRSLNENLQFKEFPVGTGAYIVTSRSAEEVELECYIGYRGKKPSVERIIFSAIPDAEKRFVALMNDEIDGYDLVAANNYVRLARAGKLTQPRDPYSICYLSLNLQHPIIAQRDIRSAIAHAIDRNSLVKKYFPQGTNVATDFLPSLFMMKHEETEAYYTYHPQITAERLKSANYKNEEIEFYYPTGVSLPWMISPEAIYASISADLVKAGFNIKPMPIPWEEGYLELISSSSKTRGIALTGFVGSYRDPNAFLSRVLAPTSQMISQAKNAAAMAPDADTEKDPEATAEPSPSNVKDTNEKALVSYQEILAAIREADQLPEPEERKEAYREINLKVAQLLPAFPLCYPVSSVALGPRVNYYPLSSTAISEISGADVRQ